MLANIYLHYVLDTKFASLKSKTAELFRFADDFVIVTKSETELSLLRQMVDGWLKEAGLNLKESKTRLVDMRDASRSYESNFTFLGFHLHLRSFDDNPKRFWIARQPSQRARREFHAKLKEKLKPHLKMEEAQVILESTWRGWSNYFKYGNSNHIFYKMKDEIRWNLTTHYLRGKYRCTRRPRRYSTLIRKANSLIRDLRPPKLILHPPTQPSKLAAI